jgi:hypothetical protein
LLAACTDALLPLLGIVFLGWSAIGYVLWFLADAVLLAAAAVAQRVNVQLADVDLGADAAWIDRLSLWAAKPLVVLLFATVVGAGVAGFFTPIILAAGWWPAIRTAIDGEWVAAVLLSAVLQTAAAPPKGRSDLASLWQQERRAALPLVLALVAISPALQLSIWLGQAGLLLTALVASVVRLWWAQHENRA